MRTSLVPSSLLVLLALAGAGFDGKGFPKLAPFTAMRFEQDAPVVRVDEAWVRLLAIDGHEAADVVAFAKQRYAGSWKKRLSEDLVEVLSTMGSPPAERVTLVVAGEDGERKTLEKVEMTTANRKRAWEYNRANPEPGAPELVPASPFSRDTPLPAADARADLAQLRERIDQRYSYAARKRDAIDAAFAAAEKRIASAETVGSAEFGLVLVELLARLGDGHSRLSTPLDDLVAPGYLPALIAVSGDRLVAFEPDRRALLDAAHPFVAAIDGRPVEDWLAAARAITSDGAPHFVREHAVRNLRFVAFLRERLGVAASPTITFDLREAGGESTARVVRKLAAKRPIYGSWPATVSKRLDGDVEYVRIESMESDPDFLGEVERRMDAAGRSRGLVIDVRGNGGGSRDVTNLVVPRLLDPASGPRVVNVAKLRLEVGERDDGDLLADRFLYPKQHSRFGDPQRKAIDALMARFQPEWTPPASGFGEWHFLVLDPTAEESRVPVPTVVLMDGGCFSATDVFLGALKGVKGVTLLGTPSGGGSGRAREYALDRSGFRVRLSSMASFLPDGSMYDGNGIEPDVVVDPAPGDFVGQGDAQLDAALARLRK